MAARCWAVGKSHVKSRRPQSLTNRQKQKENDKEKAKERKEKERTGDARGPREHRAAGGVRQESSHSSRRPD